MPATCSDKRLANRELFQYLSRIRRVSPQPTPDHSRPGPNRLEAMHRENGTELAPHANAPGDQADGQTDSGQYGAPTATERPDGRRLGRSGPRSRLGCVTCKQRRVRCDELHPVCGHCARLQLRCQYRSHPQKWKSRPSGVSNAGARAQVADSSGIETPPNLAEAVSAPNQTLGQASNGSNELESMPNLRQAQRFHDHIISPVSSVPNVSVLQTTLGSYVGGLTPRNSYGTPTPFNHGLPSWTLARTVDFDNICSEFDTSWAGELSCVLPDMASPQTQMIQQQSDAVGLGQVVGAISMDNGPLAAQLAAAPLNGVNGNIQSLESRSVPNFGTQAVQDGQTPSSFTGSREGPELGSKEDPKHLLHLFKKIHQPPAAILIGGFERWRRLQHYLCKLSEQSRAVNSALMCVIELLMIDEMAMDEGQAREPCMKRILDRHALACQEIERKLRKGTLKASSRERLLAAIFLLGWFEVIKDQDSHPSLFPRRLADAVITFNTNWNRYSQQLLSWLNTLDSKATHVGREHLLSTESLHVVSYYHTEITSSLQQGGDWHDTESGDSDQSPSEASPGESHSSPVEAMSIAPSLKLSQVKQAVLNTILQPALAWYLTSQSYCRKISAHDKHHRRRFTSDDEFEVITACKQIETELFDLWDYRPAVMSVPAEQLMAVTSPDIATRLEEIFSTYLASFWILFVYLHRVSWWHLPHSALARRALGEVWCHMQRAYSEEVNGPLRRVIHPSLLWPLFLFGSECRNEDQRNWAIQQLEALSEAKPVLAREGTDADTLPPFKLSSGATRNAHRAAMLLRELIKEQEVKKERVDDRDLSMRMFGCYFSIV